jgi:hypothetical protein
MQEAFLHYLWKHKKFNTLQLKTVAGDTIAIQAVGQHNQNSGPDFFNAQLNIANQLWAGNVEIHIKSSDWYVHQHETDKHYDNVILHVVWEYDAEIFRKDNTEIPTLELKYYVDNSLLNNYKRLFNASQKWINCETDFASINTFTLNNWLERLYFERLNRKSDEIQLILKQSTNDWEAVLFKLLAKNFGLKVNGEAFASIANSLEFSIVRKQQSNVEQLEALFFGQASLLEDTIEDAYYIKQQKNYLFLKQKFSLSNKDVTPIQFFRLRPASFPTIRLSQLAMLYSKHKNVFAKLMELKTRKAIYDLFLIETTTYWETHYTFSKESKASKKRITKAFVDLLIINTLIPLKFSYAKYQGQSKDNELVELIQEIASEKNSIINAFNKMKPISKTALHSQALIQLKANYCDKNKCLQCAIGNSILTR